ncbi:MAG: type II/IV secretion system protein, partial [Desulfobacteraceae bacterium]
MMSAVHLKTESYQSKIKSAEAYEAHGLYNEAMELYKEILSADTGLEKEVLQKVQFKVDELSKEIDDDDKSSPYNLSTEDVSHIKTGLSIGESIPEILDSATAFKELGLYREAVSEYKKLFLTDIAIDDFFDDFLESSLAVSSAADVIKDIETTITESGLNDQAAASIKFMLGVELDKRNYKEQAVKCYQSVQKIDPMYPKIKDKIESIQPDKRFDSRYDFLLRNKIVDTDQLQKALALSKKMRKSVEAVLMEQFKTSKEDIGKSLSAYYNCAFKVFDPKRQVPYELISNLKKPFLIQDVWVPVHWEIDHIEILIDDPKDLSKIDHAKALFNTNKFIFSVGIKEDIIETINFFFSQGKAQQVESKGKAADDNFDLMPDISFEEIDDDEEMVDDSVNEASGKIVQLVDQTLITAFRKNASDIHVEPSTIAKRTKIRFRIDGVCQDFLEVPNSFANAILSRIKIMANLDIAEKRMPQDGKIKFKRRGIPAFELRVATLPTADSQEDVVMRILATSGAMKVEDLTLTERNMQVLLRAIAKPYGLVLVVGPTGSGKTTTLHSALHHINTPERKIWTAEDPVEISQLGLRQVEVKNKIGLDFARIMRAFLRADPDVI